MTQNKLWTHSSVFWAGLGWVVPLNLGFLGSCSHEQTQLLWLDDSGFLAAGLVRIPGHWPGQLLFLTGFSSGVARCLTQQNRVPLSGSCWEFEVWALESTFARICWLKGHSFLWLPVCQNDWMWHWPKHSPLQCSIAISPSVTAKGQFCLALHHDLWAFRLPIFGF